MINKKKFVEIINKLKATNDFVNNVNDGAKNLREILDPSFIDFFEFGSLIIAHNDIVIELLEDMFHDSDMINWWINEIDFGRKYEKGSVSEADGTIIDVSTAEKLYDFLVKQYYDYYEGDI